MRLAGQFTDHSSTVWRVCWNVTGTVLASSGDDGQVRLWKANYMDNWSCVASLRGDGRGGKMEGIAAGKGFKTPSASMGMASGFGGVPSY